MSQASGQQITGGTIRLIIEWMSWPNPVTGVGSPTDPDTGTQSLVITNSHGVVQATISESQLTKDSVGIYHYDYVTPTVTADDWFLAQWQASLSGEPDRPRYYFLIEA